MKTISILFLIAILFVHISSNILTQDNSIYTNGSLQSDDGVFTLYVQADGNVVIYGCKGIAATWGSGTNNSTAQRRLTMQSDGNLVLYENSSAKWASGTNGKGKGPYNLNMQTDGNLVIYGSTGAIWGSNTVGNGLCQLCAYFHDSTSAGTSNQIKLAYYDFNQRYYAECYLNGTKNKATTYCCNPTSDYLSRYSSFGTGTRYMMIQIYGNDMATIGSMNVFGRQLEYFYDSDLKMEAGTGGAGEITTWSSDGRGFYYFSISTGDGVYPIVLTDIDNYYSRNGHACYWSYSFTSLT
jgi:hypothetical protein